MMKKFFLIVCGSFVGAFLALTVLCISALICSFAILSSMKSMQGLQDKSILHIALSGPIQERGDMGGVNVIGLLQGQEEPMYLSDILHSIKVAENDEKIKGILINCKGADAAPATLRQIRQAIEEFKKSSNKFVYAYASEGYSQGDYYIATVADSIFLNPVGAVDVHGMASATPYFKSVLNKIGVEMQVLRVGSYKSAVEPFLLDSISPANREQQELYLGNIWKTMEREMAASRKIDLASFDALADTVLITLSAEELKKKQLIDALCYEHDMIDRLKQLTQLGKEDDLRLAAPGDVAGDYDYGSNKDGIIAVVYAEGEIDGSDNSGINSEQLVEVIRTLQEDEEVKGLVLRVNSPGGSAFGSEQIWESLEQFKKSGKTFAVSMGDYAASGGYYISCGAHRIFADSTTLTGSIGIFGMIPCAQELIENKIGIHTSIVKTNKNADMGVGGIMAKRLTPVQYQAMQNYINRGYDLFTKRCANGRNVSQDSIKAIAQGRVWDGISAKKIGLIDQFGGLNDAIEWVARKTNLKTGYYLVQEYPVVEMDFTNFINLYGTAKYEAKMKEEMGIFYRYYEQTRQLLGRKHILCLMEPVEIK